MSKIQADFSAYNRSITGLRWVARVLTLVGAALVVLASALGRAEMPNRGMQIILLISGFASLIIASVLRVLATRKSHKLEKLLADNVTALALAEVFDLDEYAPNSAISNNEICKAGLIKDWSERYGSDLVRGRYKGCKFSFSDVDLQKRVDEKTSRGAIDTTYHNRFKGQWIILETNKDIVGELRLRERLRTELAKSNAETENTQFNSKYQIEASDVHGAFMVLTPHFMEAVMRADFLANGRTFMYFGGRQVHIAIHNERNLFEPSRKERDIAEVQLRQRREVKYITDILDIFLENKRLF
ncbi:MAG: DUF3137 domain-containing protein [Defluviitaleaceae bacterium]|nr:DUF3137 domain-containing protein [Defluviitaleaceae bacterium]